MNSELTGYYDLKESIKNLPESFWHTKKEVEELEKAIKLVKHLMIKEAGRNKEGLTLIYQRLQALKSVINSKEASLKNSDAIKVLKQELIVNCDALKTEYSKRTQPEGYVINSPNYGHNIFFDAKDYYLSLESDILNAKRSILIEVYIWQNDYVGKRICDALVKKANEWNLKNDKTRKILIIIDDLGDSKEITSRLEEAGVTVLLFNPLKNFFIKYDVINIIKHPIAAISRNHRKTTIIDNQIGYIGGMNIAEEYLHYNDVHMRLTGVPVLFLNNSFLNMLHITLNYENNHLKKIEEAMVKKEYDALNNKLPGGNNSFKIISNKPSILKYMIREEYLSFIRSAQKNIFIMNAYFIPGNRLVKELQDAAKRGVDVRIMLSRTSDHAINDYGSKIFLERLVSAGVKIYLYQSPSHKMIHGKVMSVDGKYSTIGSSNLDFISVSLNYEVNIFFADQAIARDIEAKFIKDLAYCAPLGEEFVQAHKKRGSIDKLKEKIVYFIIGGGLLKPRIPKEVL